MLSAIGRTIAIGALCFSLGMHWLALQSIAWTTMLINNARHEPLRTAVAKTFDGAHPCGLCQAVAAGKKSENQTPAPTASLKIDLICPSARTTYRPPGQFLSFVSWAAQVRSRAESPPTPPPRFRIG